MYYVRMYNRTTFQKWPQICPVKPNNFKSGPVGKNRSTSKTVAPALYIYVGVHRQYFSRNLISSGFYKYKRASLACAGRLRSH